MTPKETQPIAYDEELLANKSLHTFIQRNPATAKWIKPMPVFYDKHTQTYHYLCTLNFLIAVFNNMDDHNMRLGEAAYFTLVSKLMNND